MSNIETDNINRKILDFYVSIMDDNKLSLEERMNAAERLEQLISEEDA